ncbi:MAG: glycosyltransferase family 2 protein [Desulfocucumaceae bacterium]
MSQPLVSVITPVFNSVRYLELCINSVLDQSCPHIEHILVDGGSTDGTVEVLKKYGERFPDRIRYMSGPDRGACDAWNKGWAMARGEILGWLGADDLYHPGTAEKVVEYFALNPGTFFLHGGCDVIDEEGRVIVKVPARDFNLKEIINGSNSIIAPAAFYRREVIERVGPLDTSINTCDHDYWIRVGKVFPIARTEEVLASFRIHRGSVSGSDNSFKVYLRENYYLRKKHGGRIFPDFTLRWLAFQLVELARLVPGLGNPDFYYRYISPLLVRWRQRGSRSR